MWLVLDAGNSALKGGLFREGELLRTFRVETDAADTWPARLRRHLGEPVLERAGVASVVPTVTERLRTLLAAHYDAPLLVVGPHLRLPFRLAYTTPDTLGTDRIAAAVAAWGHAARDERPVVAVDAGTAVTYEVVHGGVYRGGAIGPGPRLLRRALHHGTAQLPEVPLHYPVDVIGTSTQGAIQSGLMHGFVDGVQGMLERLRRQLAEPLFVVATGGWGTLLTEQIEAVDVMEPHLVLHGIHALMTMNPPAEGG